MIQSQRHKAPAGIGVTPIDHHAPVAVQDLSVKLRNTPREVVDISKTAIHPILISESEEKNHFVELHFSPHWAWIEPGGVA